MTPIPGYAIKISQFGFFFRLVSVKIVLGDFVPVFNTRNVNFKQNTLYKETNKKEKKWVTFVINLNVFVIKFNGIENIFRIIK